ncbi:MAG TPA: CPBP family intramembrane glutamic endopeptidase [Acidimicrobiales bacterium]|nr:CPBP family intramembrane glutamic endopeptidase [Acidimicrobiales bacterium]
MTTAQTSGRNDPDDPAGAGPGPAERSPAPPGPDRTPVPSWGTGVAAGGFLAGLILAGWAVALWDASTGARRRTYGTDVVGLIGLWLGMLGAVAVFTRFRGRRPLAASLGLRFRPRDIPLGLGCGLGSQFLLVPVLYLPLRAVSPHIYRDLGRPAESLTRRAHGPGFAILAVLVVVGAPVVEELFFRGLLQRSLAGWVGPGPAIGMAAVSFGLAHGEAVQLVALIAFGVVLGLLAQRSGRLGPGIVAHAAFNGATIAVIALSR